VWMCREIYLCLPLNFSTPEKLPYFQTGDIFNPNSCYSDTSANSFFWPILTFFPCCI
jgi:hypothetical protein